MDDRRQYLTQFREHLKGWRLLNGIVLKHLSSKALRDIKNGSGTHYTAEMKRLVTQAKSMCVNADLDTDPITGYPQGVLDMEIYSDAKAVFALTYDRQGAKLVGFCTYVTHKTAEIEWKKSKLRKLADNRQVGELVLVCTSSQSSMKGLGRFLTLQAMYELAKAWSKGAPRYEAYVLEAAGAQNYDPNNADTYNYKMFQTIGFKDTVAYEKGTNRAFTQEMIIDDVLTTYEPVFMTIEPTVARPRREPYEVIPLAKLQQVLNLPDMHEVCPVTSGTGRSRCQQWITIPPRPQSLSSRSARVANTRAPRRRQ